MSLAAAFYSGIAPCQCPLEICSEVHPDLEIKPLRGRVWFFNVVWQQNQISSGQQDLTYLWVLFQLCLHRCQDQAVMNALLLRPVSEPLACTKSAATQLM